MKKKLIATGLISFMLYFGFSQTTITLQPDSINGKDAQVFDLFPDLNMGSHYEFEIYAWTDGGTPTFKRCFIDFDFSLIPVGATIISANLMLFNNPTSTSSGGEHSQLSGTNELLIERVTQSWDENSITWNNQPNATEQHQVIVPPSTSSHQNYSVDILNLAQDIVENPSTSFGLRLTLLTEQHYRSIIFASSDHTNSDLHPKLEITYSNPVAVEEVLSSNELLKIYPNPTSEKLIIDRFDSAISEINIIDISGKLIRTVNQTTNAINVTDLSNGVYFIKLNSDKGILTAKFVKQ